MPNNQQIKTKTTYKTYHIWLLCLLAFASSFSQESFTINQIAESFTAYTKLPREVAYGHLNKSTFIKGETLAFTVYVFDKNSKQLSTGTSNVYCAIVDTHGKIVKHKMLLAQNGVCYGSFFVDEQFASGNYNFQAYTNWMKNFDEQNFYVQAISIIDPVEATTPPIVSSKLDIQLLPEGGHLVANTQNTVGIVVKDTLGLGVPNTTFEVLDSDNQSMGSMTTNQFGIGKFALRPNKAATYKVKVQTQEITQIQPLPIAEAYGIAMTLNKLNDKIILRFHTNTDTFKPIQNKPYTLVVHNGHDLKTISIQFTDAAEILTLIPHQDLFKGMNILTLFDEKGNPILERLYFKHEGIQLVKSEEVNFEQGEDSTLIKIPMKAANPKVFNNFSLSVLPAKTKSYQHNQNIISALYLQPYVKGFIENAQYYFTDIDRQKEFELDLLLLTQGWSSYNWENIFNHPPTIKFPFEQGITIKAHINQSKSNTFAMFPITYNDFETFELKGSNASFEKQGLYPLDKEQLRFVELNRKNSGVKPHLFLEFTPSKIPNLEKHLKIEPIKQPIIFNSNNSQAFLINSWSGLEQLDEIVLSVRKKESRKEQLSQQQSGKIDVFDDNLRKSYMDFASYIRTKGFMVYQNNGQLNIINPSAASATNNSPMVYLDDMRLFDLNTLYQYRLDIVDYILVDKSGFGQGANGTAGVIKIYTDPKISFTFNESSPFQTFNIPLTFSSPTKFYTPKYAFYQTQFYKEYGVVNWLPNCKVDAQDNITFKIDNIQTGDLKIFIEGTCNDGILISEVKRLQIN
ncbi:carboxypeptidase-like regulatory domain-containing protein [Mangrovimonas sp. TPBH4]|uniref:carboxypeptidase-like regulatory domain-containing protein n=1 Tax=Mangrovimonas sp. TPBH4 TaxID=1645914 RepID=UPI0006B61B89|nr:carboxypeptidase-like regulatory domain-containing protein [Mangrovimonas sp. TPBH4]